MRIYAAGSLGLLTIALLAPPAAAQSIDQQQRICYKESGDTAIAACTAAIVSGQLTSANLAIVYYNRGFEFANRKDDVLAIADYSEAIRLNPQDPDFYDNRGLAYARKGNYARAIVEYDQALRLSPRDAWSYNKRGIAKKALGRTAEGEADIAKAKAIDPHIAD